VAGGRKATGLASALLAIQTAANGLDGMPVPDPRHRVPAGWVQGGIRATQRLGYTLLAERLPVRYAARFSRDTVKRMIGFRDV
jgi:hypothetical protein